MHMTRRMVWLALLATVVVGAAGCLPYTYKGALLDPPQPLDDFALPTATGGTFRLSDYRGRVVLLYFGYTFCPDICPTTLYQVSQAMEKLGDDAQQVTMAMVTVDPERDTPEHLARYVAGYHETFLGLRTTDLDALDAVLAQFGAFYEIAPHEEGDTSYTVSHTAALFLIDQKGQWREVFAFGTPAEDLAADIRRILNER